MSSANILSCLDPDTNSEHVERTQQNSGSDASLGNIAKLASLKSQSQILRFYLQSLARQLLPDERVAQCLRTLAPHRAELGVDIMYSPSTNRARYRNLIICGRIWQCPVCAARITEQKRQQLTKALTRGPYRKILVTYTLRHNKGDRLEDLLVALLGDRKCGNRGAYGDLKSGKAWQSITYMYGWFGSVRGLEPTYGVNGWHPHIHELVFISPDMPAAVFQKLSPEYALIALETALKERWQHVLAKRGYDASWEHGVDLRSADEDVLEYVAKFGHEPINPGWTIERELTKSASKVSDDPIHGKTPFQLLLDYGEGDERAGELFQEYAAAFKGRNQLTWSRGLREALNLGAEPSDEELAEQPLADDEKLLSNLTPKQWQYLLHKSGHGRELRGELIQVLQASKGNVVVLWNWLNQIGLPQLVNLNDYMWQEYEKRHAHKKDETGE